MSAAPGARGAWTAPWTPGYASGGKASEGRSPVSGRSSSPSSPSCSSLAGVGYLIFVLMRKQPDGRAAGHRRGRSEPRSLVIEIDDQGREIVASQEAPEPARDTAGFENLLKDEMHDLGRPAADGGGRTDAWASPSTPSSCSSSARAWSCRWRSPVLPATGHPRLPDPRRDRPEHLPAVPGIDLDGYQSYDKALDVYYLTVAFISTLRNWLNPAALRDRPLPLLLPPRRRRALRADENRDDPVHLPEHVRVLLHLLRGRAPALGPDAHGAQLLIGGAALIWIFVKLPQEWWIHIAQLDMTDFIKETIFGVAADPTAGAGRHREPAVGDSSLADRVLRRWAPPWSDPDRRRARRPTFDHRARHRGRPAAAEPLRGAEPIPQGARRDQDLRLGGSGRRPRLTAIVCVDLFAPHDALGGRSQPAGRHGGDRRGASSRWSTRAVSHVTGAAAARSWRRLAGELATMVVVNLVIVVAPEALERWLGVALARADAVRYDARLRVTC